MIRPDKQIPKVFLYKKSVDMRKQMNGLSVIVEQAMSLNPFSGSLFVFINKQKDKVKILVWENNGYIVWYKRLEKGRFQWPVHHQQDIVTLTGEELNWLLDGFNLWLNKPHKKLEYRFTS